MRPLRYFVLAVPVLAGIVVPFAPAEVHRRHGGGAALIAGLIGLGLGAVAGNAFTGRSDQYEPTYSQPNYGPPPGYGYGPAYAAPPPVMYAPPSVIYAQPPVVAYAPPPAYYAPRGVYAHPGREPIRTAPSTRDGTTITDMLLPDSAGGARNAAPTRHATANYRNRLA